MEVIACASNGLSQILPPGTVCSDTAVLCDGLHSITSSRHYNRSSHLYRSYDNGSPGEEASKVGRFSLTDSFFVPFSVNDVVIHPNQGELISCDQSGAIKQWDLSENSCTLELVRKHEFWPVLRPAGEGSLNFLPFWSFPFFYPLCPATP